MKRPLPHLQNFFLAGLYPLPSLTDSPFLSSLDLSCNYINDYNPITKQHINSVPDKASLLRRHIHQNHTRSVCHLLSGSRCRMPLLVVLLVNCGENKQDFYRGNYIKIQLWNVMKQLDVVVSPAAFVWNP